MPTPTIIVNFKAYAESTGDRAIVLARVCESIAHESGIAIGVAVSALDIAAVVAAVDIPVYAQHVDAASVGAATGHIVPESVRAAGAVGTLVNHAEYRVIETIEAHVKAAKRAGLTTIVCAATADEAAIIATFAPDAIAVEPPELIGGDISVTTAQPDIIGIALAAVGDIPLIVGAGVKNAIDVATAIRLGAVGVLLASGVVKATDPAAVLRDLTAGVREAEASRASCHAL